MNTQDLIDTAKMLVAKDKGLLAMDESIQHVTNDSLNGNSANRGNRRSYRELIVTTPGLGEFISGVILYDETIRQSKKTALPFLKSYRSEYYSGHKG